MLGEKVILHSYKHDKSLHRVWKNETLLDETDEYIVVANKKTRVIEANGRFWYTKEPSVAIFFKSHWYNVIGIIKKTGICYYCNLSSPILRDEEALKYIDYDLDIKVNEDFTYNILDMNEYNRNKEIMNYPENVEKILLLELENLKERINSRRFPFEESIILKWYRKFEKIKDSKTIDD